MIAAGWVAISLAVVIAVSVVSLVALFTVGEPFGRINDVGNALIGVLSAALALLLMNQAGGWPGVLAAVIGAGFALWGSWLVMSGATGFLLASFVSSIGFGLIGVWLALVAWSPMAGDWSDLLRGLARAAAVALIIGGLASVPGALMRIDSFDDLPAWMWVFSLGWLGLYVLLPIVAIGVGRRLIGP